jgi:hypothetical protein
MSRPQPGSCDQDGIRTAHLVRATTQEREAGLAGGAPALEVD